jgi:hypothetical protein
MSVDDMSVDNMSVDNMSVDDMALDWKMLINFYGHLEYFRDILDI